MTNIGNNKETHDIVENSVYTPSEVLERIMQAGEKRILLPVVRCILLGMLAGGFIAFGAAASQRCNLFPDYGIRRGRLGTLRCKYVLPAGRNFCCV